VLPFLQRGVEGIPAVGKIIEAVLNNIPSYWATAVPSGADTLAYVAEMRVDLVLLALGLRVAPVGPTRSVWR